MGNPKWNPDPVSEAIIAALEGELQTYREVMSELEMEIQFLRRFANKEDVKRADSALSEAIAKLFNSNIIITGY